jgi:hypothetical protein
VLTGLLHEPQPVGAQLFASFYPAMLDPVFATSGLDPGYLTTQPGTARESADYAPDACLEAYVLSMSGHDINLHPNAGDWFAAANSWLSRHTDTGC